MSHTTVRRAQASDLDQLTTLFEGYRAFYRCAPNQQEARAFLSERLANGDSAIFVAVDDAGSGGLTGFVQLYPVFSSLHMRRAFILNDLFVAPAHRKHGTARQLMDAARALAADSGAASITLETARDNHTARRLYESLGYRLEQTFDQYVLELR